MLSIKEQILEEKDSELKQMQKEVEKLLEERRTQLLALEEEKEKTRIQVRRRTSSTVKSTIYLLAYCFILVYCFFLNMCVTGQTEQLVNQQILIDRLRSPTASTTSRATEAKSSGNLYNRPHSVPLTRHSGVHRASRKVGTCCVGKCSCVCLLYHPHFETALHFNNLTRCKYCCFTRFV